MPPAEAAQPLVRVEDLRVRFTGRHSEVAAVRGVDLTVAPGECLALVGESGSGKSTVARALLGLTGPGAEVTARRFDVDGRDARRFDRRTWQAVRGRRIALVSQDALVALDPLRRIGAEIAEPMRLHGTAPRAEIAARVEELLTRVGVPEPARRAAQYPHELSGGLRQRALLASALAADPGLLVADEPTTALDATVQAQVLELFREARSQGRGLLLITHDLSVVARLADRTAVLRAGEVVEAGPTAELLADPQHPYTKELLAAADPAPRRPRPPAGGRAVLSAERIGRSYGGRAAAAGIDFRLHAGECVGLVGESGSGKSTVARIAVGLLAPDTGEVRLDGEPWVPLPERSRRQRRHRIQLIHQDPFSSFDPRYTVRRVLREALEPALRRDRTAAEQSMARLLSLVGLDPEHLGRRPAQLSGGQRQRVAIARALARDPEVLVCDEPVSALDASVQAQVLDLLDSLRERLGLALLFISHDLSVVRRISDRVLVMRDGRVVEQGPTERIYADPQHPFTRALLAASLPPSRTGRTKLATNGSVVAPDSAEPGAKGLPGRAVPPGPAAQGGPDSPGLPNPSADTAPPATAAAPSEHAGPTTDRPDQDTERFPT
jgi:peptide/nickel transport system ATP-binding protein